MRKNRMMVNKNVAQTKGQSHCTQNMTDTVNNNQESAEQQDVHQIFEKGVTLGTTVIGMLALTATNWMNLGAAAVGLALAVAALKDVARRSEGDVDQLFDDELRHFEAEYAKMDLEEEE